MKIALVLFALISPTPLGIAAEDAARLQACPKEILKLFQGDVRRAFLNITFSAKSEKEEDQRLAALIAKAFGGPYLTFDVDDEDTEYQATVTDGEGDKKRTVSFLYNQSEGGWVLVGALLGAFPVGSTDKHDGWRDISTREPLPGPGNAELIRTYRHTKDGYSEIYHSVDSGG